MNRITLCFGRFAMGLALLYASLFTLSGCSKEKREARAQEALSSKRDSFRPSHFGTYLWNGTEWQEIFKGPPNQTVGIQGSPSVIIYEANLTRMHSIELICGAVELFKVRYDVGQIYRNEKDNVLRGFQVDPSVALVTLGERIAPEVSPMNEQRDMIRFDFNTLADKRVWSLGIGRQSINVAYHLPVAGRMGADNARATDCHYRLYSQEDYWAKWDREQVKGESERTNIFYMPLSHFDNQLLPQMLEAIDHFVMPADPAPAITAASALNNIHHAKASSSRDRLIKSFRAWLDEKKLSHPLEAYLFIEKHRAVLASSRWFEDLDILSEEAANQIASAWQSCEAATEEFIEADRQAYNNYHQILKKIQDKTVRLSESVKVVELFDEDGFAKTMYFFDGWLNYNYNNEAFVFLPDCIGDEPAFNFRKKEEKFFLSTNLIILFAISDSQSNEISGKLSAHPKNIANIEKLSRLIEEWRRDPALSPKGYDRRRDKELGIIRISQYENKIDLLCTIVPGVLTPYFELPVGVKIKDGHINKEYVIEPKAWSRGGSGTPQVEYDPSNSNRFRVVSKFAGIPGSVSVLRLPLEILGR